VCVSWARVLLEIQTSAAAVIDVDPRRPFDLVLSTREALNERLLWHYSDDIQIISLKRWKKNHTHTHTQKLDFSCGTCAALTLSRHLGISSALHIGSERGSINSDTPGLCLIFTRANCGAPLQLPDASRPPSPRGRDRSSADARSRCTLGLPARARLEPVTGRKHPSCSLQHTPGPRLYPQSQRDTDIVLRHSS